MHTLFLYLCVMVAAFTGHRSYGGEENNRLQAVVEQLISEGVDTFLCGMAEGFDIAAAEVVIALKRRFKSIKLVCIIPYKGHREAMPSSCWMVRYQSTLAAADSVITLAEEYSYKAYRIRNDYLVANADIIVSYYTGRSRSGTGYTVTKALKNRKRTINIYADGEQIRFFG